MTSGEVMCDSGIKQGCSLSPTLFGLYIDELEHIWTPTMGILRAYLT